MSNLYRYLLIKEINLYYTFVIYYSAKHRFGRYSGLDMAEKRKVYQLRLKLLKESFKKLGNNNEQKRQR